MVNKPNNNYLRIKQKVFTTVFLISLSISPILFAQYIRKDVMISDNNFIPLNALSHQSQYRKLSEGIGKLQTPFGSCTAFLISEDYILTNQHCVEFIDRNSEVTFLLGYLSEGQGLEYDVNPTPLELDSELDYAILEVYGDPASFFEIIPLNLSDPTEYDTLFLMGHPEGQALALTESCFLSGIRGSRIHYGCSSMPGSSGSPVFARRKNGRFALVGLHHAGTTRGYNQGIRILSILNKSNILQDLYKPKSSCSCSSKTPIRTY